MGMICPECMGALEMADGQVARCTVHGGQYQVLFTKVPVEEPPMITATPVEASAVCVKHPEVAAVAACARCSTPLCDTCTFPGFNGRRVCLACVPYEPRNTLVSPPPVPAPIQIPTDAMCLQHREVPATNQCKRCGAYMCATCDFTLPGNVHLCPTCATAPAEGLSAQRKRHIIISYIMAAVGTFGMALIMSGALRSLRSTPGGVALAGYVFMGLVLVPSVIGAGYGVGAKSRRNANPISLWIAVIWNVVLVAIFLLLCVIGNLKS